MSSGAPGFADAASSTAASAGAAPRRGTGAASADGSHEFGPARLAARLLDGSDHGAEKGCRTRRLGQMRGDAVFEHKPREIDLVDGGQEHDRDGRGPDVGLIALATSAPFMPGIW